MYNKSDQGKPQLHKFGNLSASPLLAKTMTKHTAVLNYSYEAIEKGNHKKAQHVIQKEIRKQSVSHVSQPNNTTPC